MSIHDPVGPGEKPVSEMLLPCPFCGAGETKLFVVMHADRRVSESNPPSVWVHVIRHWCDYENEASKVYGGTDVSLVADSPEDAIALWNARA